MPRPFKRNNSTSPIGKKILIACEGKYTEPQYFKAIRQDLHLPKELIKVVPYNGTDPLNIVYALLNAKQDEKIKKGWEKEDSAWAVFDGDEHIKRDLDNWDKAIQKAKSQKVNLAITNPSIEFWYLIHFEEYSAHISADSAERYLRQYIPNYDKSECYYQKLLKVRTKDAIARANKLTNSTKNDNLFEYSNPCCSGISKLVQILFSLDN